METFFYNLIELFHRTKKKIKNQATIMIFRLQPSTLTLFG